MEYTNKFPTAIQSPGSNLDNHFGSYLQSERPRKLIRGCNYFIHWAGNFKGKFQRKFQICQLACSSLDANLTIGSGRIQRWLSKILPLSLGNSCCCQCNSVCGRETLWPIVLADVNYGPDSTKNICPPHRENNTIL